MNKFHVGQRVKIVVGGWGIHPKFIGNVVTIHSVIRGHSPEDTRYTTEETLTDSEVSVPHRGKFSTAHGNSFAAVPVEATSGQIRSVNAQIKEQDDILKAAQAEKARLNGKRQVLVATLLRELDV